jgi:hypothetical protein
MAERVFVLVGRKAAGKDTLGEIIMETIRAEGKVGALAAFAAPMKATLVTMFGFPDTSYFCDHNKKERLWPAYCATHTPRQLMEWFGTDVVRQQFGRDFWVNRLVRDVETAAADAKADAVVVTDARFVNEVSTLRERWGKKVRVIYIDSDERLGPLPAGASAPELAVRDTLGYLRASGEPYLHLYNNTTVDEFKVAFKTWYVSSK